MRNFTIAQRIQLSFIAAISMVLITGFLSYFYLNKLNDDLEVVVTKDIALARLAEEIKNNVFNLHQKERKFIATPFDSTAYNELQDGANHMNTLINKAHGLAGKEENSQRFQAMAQATSEYRTLITTIHTSEASPLIQGRMHDLLLKVRALNLAVLKDRYKELEVHQIEADQLASSAQRNMIIVVLFMLLSGLTLGFVAPNLVSAPFNRMASTIHEVRDGNLNVTFPVSTEDELGQLAKELNAMLHDLRTFDDMKIKRIAFEQRRLETMANMIDYGVMVVSCEGEIEYINSQLYLLLGVDSDDVVGCKIDKANLPASIKALLNVCMEDQEKIHNQAFTLTLKDGETTKDIALAVDSALVRNHEGSVVNFIVTFEDYDVHGKKTYLTRKLAGA